jgi:fructokinase
MMTAEKELTFLMLGEAVVDLISSGIVSTLEEANSFQRFPGGEVSNLALNLARLGYETALGACLGDDGFGRYLKAQYRQAGVNLNYLQTCRDAPTTVITVARQTETPDFIIFRGADKNFQDTEALRRAAETCRAVHTSAGSLAHDPCRGSIVRLLEAARRQGKLISLDPNYHPKIWPDRDDFVSFLKELYTLITVTKPSLDDSQRIFGPDREPQEYLEAFLDLGPELVALTMGRHGVMIGTQGGGFHRLEANPISVVDVTGAGDAFWSGLLAGLLAGKSPLESARMGQAIAEHKIGVLGPILEYPAMQEIEKRAQSIMVSSI